MFKELLKQLEERAKKAGVDCKRLFDLYNPEVFELELLENQSNIKDVDVFCNTCNYECELNPNSTNRIVGSNEKIKFSDVAKLIKDIEDRGSKDPIILQEEGKFHLNVPISKSGLLPGHKFNIQCPNCNVLIEDLTKFCLYCEAEVKICVLCGKLIQEGEKIIACPCCEFEFHKPELAKWLKDSETCPVCREKLSLSIDD